MAADVVGVLAEAASTLYDADDDDEDGRRHDDESGADCRSHGDFQTDDTSEAVGAEVVHHQVRRLVS